MTYRPFTFKSFIPAIDDGYAIGTSSLRWKDGYFGPDSLHIVSNIAESGVATDWNFSIDSDGYLSTKLINNDGYLTVTRFGNVGIGTTHPTQKLQVDGYVKANPGFVFGDGSIMTSAATGSSVSVAGTSGAIQFNSGGSLGADTNNLFWDDTNNRLGIGTSSPARPLDVLLTQNGETAARISNASNGTGAITALYLSGDTNDSRILHHGSGFTTSGVLVANQTELLETGAGGLLFTTIAASAPTVFAAANGGTRTEQARFLATGEFLIGTTTPVSAELFAIQKNQNSETYQIIQNSSTGTGANSGLYLRGNGDYTHIAHLGSAFATSGLLGANTTVLLESGAGGIVVSTIGAAPIIFATDNPNIASNEKMRITSTGVLINTTSQYDSALLTVRKDQNAELTMLALQNDSSGSGAGVALRLIGAGDDYGKLQHFGSSFAGAGLLTANSTLLLETGGGGVVIGSIGSAPVVIAQGNPNTAGNERLRFSTTEVVFNDASANINFRIESLTNDKMFFVDSSNNRVGIGTLVPNEVLTVEGRLSLRETTTPITSANYGKIYAKSSDNNLYFKSGVGVEYNLSSPTGTGANTSLSNLTTTTVNASLIPAVDDAYSLGSSSFRWKDGYFANTSLHVVSTAGETGVATDWNWSLNSDGYSEFRNVNSSYLTITRFGNVGIGTTHPTQKFEVDGYIKAVQGFKFGDNTIMTTASSGSATPAGSSGAVQFNNSGALGADSSNLFWDDSNNYLGLRTSVPLHTLDAYGSVGFNITTVTTNTTLDDTYHTVLVDANGASRTINLPAVASTVRRRYEIKKIDGSANTVTIDGNASETIDGSLTIILNTQYQGITIVTDGIAWYIV